MKKEGRGLLTWDALVIEVEGGRVETVILGFSDHYGRLMGKRFDAEYFVGEVHTSGTHGCDYLLTTDMEMEPVPGYRFANWELGYGDFHMVPDLSTIRLLSWQRKTALILCDLERGKDHKSVQISPRHILREQLKRLKDLGLSCKAASELEYYTFEETYREAHHKDYYRLKPTGWYLEDYHILQGTRMERFTAKARKHLKRSGVPVENSKGEWGLGQHELNIRFAEALEMADRHIVFKQCLKEVAEKCGLSATFMAKPNRDQAGSSCHIHVSLWKDDVNAFTGKNIIGPVSCSDTFRHFLGGCIHYAPDVMPFFAPTINSYKRYVDGSWAPTRLAWSYDNRTAGFRVVGSGSSLRIENRIPGADCNPYLAYAALLASGMAGIREKIDPPELFQGDIYEARHLKRVPYTLQEATALFEKSAPCRSFFGDEVVEHYTHFFKMETKAYQSAVTDWERKRYFERI